MYYNLKTSSNEILCWAMDVILMRKGQYIKFLDLIDSGEEIPEFRFLMEEIWHKEGITLGDFDDEIETIQKELDSDLRYEHIK